MEIEYKKLEQSDYDFVSRLVDENLKEVITKSFNGYFNIALFFSRAMQMGYSYIIYCDGVQCGFIWYSVKSQSLHVNTIVIDSEYQGRGIGSGVFRELEKLARSQGYPYLQLGVQGVNTSAQNFYLKRGFKSISYTREFDTYYMQKKL